MKTFVTIENWRIVGETLHFSAAVVQANTTLQTEAALPLSQVPAAGDHVGLKAVARLLLAQRGVEVDPSDGNLYIFGAAV